MQANRVTGHERINNEGAKGEMEKVWTVWPSCPFAGQLRQWQQRFA
jgi:hypothetical protein